MPARDQNQYVEVAMHFGCNLRCEHCMIAHLMGRLQPQSKDQFLEVLEYNRRQRRWAGLILTGAEITLRRDLPDLARMARQHDFSHVRIQTHGMRLADEAYCRQLVEAGIDEYFISISAADAQAHDQITRVPGSFDRLMRALANLQAFDGVAVMTNTVVTTHTFHHLPEIVRRLAGLPQLVRMEFWAYWPMHSVDDKDLIACHADVLPYLREAIALARLHGRDAVVKNFPECLLADMPGVLDNGQPALFIDPAFWPEFQKNGFEQCVHRAACASRQCLGLNTAYIRKHGWQSDVLRPLSAVPVGSTVA